MICTENTSIKLQVTIKIKQYILFIFITVSFFLKQNVSAQRFAVIGDYGSNQAQEADVAGLIKSWNVDFIITTGDNNYLSGSDTTIDRNIGKYYHEYIYPYLGNYGIGDSVNRFFPSLGNHDLETDSGKPYFNYFTLPGNERYYDFIKGNVHFFALNSNVREPDGMVDTSAQAIWLKNKLLQSTSYWKLVYFHHSPYSSGTHGNEPKMQWPFKEWGASAVLSGHDHTYERSFVDSIPYFVNGLGGFSIYSFNTINLQSVFKYNGDYGAMLVEATKDSIFFRFINRSSDTIDYFVITNKKVSDIVKPKTQFFPEQIYIYPNPFSNLLIISFPLSEPGNVNLSLLNILGQEIQNFQQTYSNSGNQTLAIPSQTIKPGIYFLTIQTVEYCFVIKWMMANE